MKTGLAALGVLLLLLALAFGLATTLPIWPFTPYARSGSDYVKVLDLPSTALARSLAKCLLGRGESFLRLRGRTYVDYSIWKDPEIAAKYTSEAVSLMVKETPGLTLPEGYELKPHIPTELHEALKEDFGAKVSERTLLDASSLEEAPPPRQ